MNELTEIIPGEIIHIDSQDNKQGVTVHTVRFTDNTTGEDTTGVWEETTGEVTTGWGYTETTNVFTQFERVQ